MERKIRTRSERRRTRQGLHLLEIRCGHDSNLHDGDPEEDEISQEEEAERIEGEDAADDEDTVDPEADEFDPDHHDIGGGD